MYETDRERQRNDGTTHGTDATDCSDLAFVRRYVSRRRRPVSLTELAAELVSRDADERVVRPPAGEVDHVRTRLYHDHVPRLADAGHLRWYREDGTVYVAAR